VSAEPKLSAAAQANLPTHVAVIHIPPRAERLQERRRRWLFRRAGVGRVDHQIGQGLPGQSRQPRQVQGYCYCDC